MSLTNLNSARKQWVMVLLPTWRTHCVSTVTLDSSRSGKKITTKFKRSSLEHFQTLSMELTFTEISLSFQKKTKQTKVVEMAKQVKLKDKKYLETHYQDQWRRESRVFLLASPWAPWLWWPPTAGRQPATQEQEGLTDTKRKEKTYLYYKAFPRNLGLFNNYAGIVSFRGSSCEGIPYKFYANSYTTVWTN